MTLFSRIGAPLMSSDTISTHKDFTCLSNRSESSSSGSVPEQSSPSERLARTKSWADQVEDEEQECSKQSSTKEGSSANRNTESDDSKLRKRAAKDEEQEGEKSVDEERRRGFVFACPKYKNLLFCIAVNFLLVYYFLW